MVDGVLAEWIIVFARLDALRNESIRLGDTDMAVFWYATRHDMHCWFFEKIEEND